MIMHRRIAGIMKLGINRGSASVLTAEQKKNDLMELLNMPKNFI
jgi:hypothetical protein